MQGQIRGTGNMTYSETLSQRLQAMEAGEGSRLSVTVNGLVYEGTLMPHHQFSDPDVIVLKMKSGYNVGIRVGQENQLLLLEKPNKPARLQREAQRKEGLKDLVLIGTGGTIASYVDYRTGAVHPALSTADMVNAVPELGEEANIRARVLFSIFSENMSVQHWQELAEAVADELNSGVEGVIIPHGTDTMGYTAAALSFMLGDVNRPVTLVGAQRSSDRPSSDASSNLLAAARFNVRSDAAEVGVLMHDTPSDDHFAVHRGTRVRKMHTSRRDAFQSINSPPLASMDSQGSVSFNTDDYRRKGQRRVQARTEMDTDVVLLQYYPGMSPRRFEGLITDSRGVVISGSGLGHVNDEMLVLLQKAVAKGVKVVMTSQCLHGQTNLNVYATGRDLLKAGVIPVADMLPETAYVKLMWALANHDDSEVEKVMRTPLCGEMGDRREIDV